MAHWALSGFPGHGVLAERRLSASTALTEPGVSAPKFLSEPPLGCRMAGTAPASADAAAIPGLPCKFQTKYGMLGWEPHGQTVCLSRAVT